MMADRRRRSPEPSSRRRKESRRSEYYDDATRTGTGMRSGAESIYSSSSSSYEYIDISHSFPPNRSGLKTFFTAPSERRLRKRRSSRLLKHSNSSSESVGDLAYGHGYLRRPKRKVRSRKGKEIDRERYSERERERERYTEGYSDREREKSGIGRATTDAEILAVGAGLAKLAREQNKLDLKAAARGGKQGFAVRESGRREDGTSRGLGPSKISHGSDTVDEDGWESASDAESESSVDSRLAFGAESQGGWGFFGRKTYKPQSRKSSIVDPRLFGPANSLHGVVTQPVGFGEVSWNSSSDFGQGDSYTQGGGESVASGSLPPMQHVYPYATEDSTKFDAARSSVVSGPELYVSSRPGPIPIQQPQPITPVSQSVYEPIYGTRSETGPGILKKTPSSSGGRSKSLAEAALFGVAGAAVGAAIASDRKDDRKERRRDDDRDTREEDRTPKRRDSERKESKDDRRRDKRDSPDRDDRKEKRREKNRTKDSPEDRKDKKREKRRDDGREETRDERRERRREERRSERGDDRYDDQRSERSDGRYEPRRTKSETVVSQVPVDPFQYQVDNDAFATPNNEPETGHGRVQSVPTVVTVEREPNFSRKRSSSIKDQPVSSRSGPGRKDYADWDEREQRSRTRDSRDGPLHEAEAIYEEERHFTAPVDAAAISAAIAAEGYRESRSERRRDERRGERRSGYDDYDYKPRDKESTRDSKDYDDYDRKPRDKESKRERERDPIQEEADRAYREIVMARKIASQVIRSRSPSPSRSVVDKYEKEEEEVIRIVTPPGMEDHKKKGLYDAPNADFQLDHVLKDPQELRRFSLPFITRDLSNSDAPFLKKDPDAVEPRPFLNLVLPTPSPSPLPEKQVARSEPAQPSKPQVDTTTTAASDVVIGPKSNVVSSPSASTVSKGVTWGENETKHFEVESPSEHRDEFVSSPEIQARDDPVEQPKSSNGSKRSGWGAITAGIIGAGAGAATAAASSSETSKTSKSSKAKENEKKQDAPYEYRGVVVEPESPPRSQRQRSPPTTGPKPTSSQTSQSSHIPGAFDDDLDFTATVAAGLQDTGFDPSIVINDPKFRRRDSPPGSNEPIYRAPYAETVSDLGSVIRDAPPTRDGQGYVIGEVATTPKDWPTVSPDEEDTPTKLSKKDQKKREKAAKRQSGDFTPLDESSKTKDIVEEPETYFETKLSNKEQKKRDKEARRQGTQPEDITPFDEPSVGTEIVEEPESYFEEPKKKSKKSKKGSSYDDDVEETLRDSRKVSVPVDTFDDLRNGEDEWSEKKSKRKSKRDSERYDSPSRSAPSNMTSPLERTSSLSKKSKDKSKRKSDQYEPDPTEVSLPPSTPSENSRDGDFEESRGTRKSSNKDSADRGESRSVVSADASRYDDDEPRKSKRKSKSRDDFDDTRSVASAPAGDDYEHSKRSKKKDKDKRSSGGFFGLFGSKSEVGTGTRDDSPKRSKDDFEEIKKKSKKSKRSSIPDASSLYGDTGSESVGDLSRITSNGNGHGNGAYYFDDDQDRDSRDESKKKSRTRDESTSSKKDSFLAKAGTLGAGVGLAGAAAAIAAQRHQQSNADNAYESNDMTEQTRSRGSSRSRQLEEILDPEITQRQFRPSIDPQYGDLLPLPPSDPVSPNVELIDDLPDLPDSRPDTPEAERLPREKAMVSARKTIQDTPMKSPSHSAVPLKFIMGNRSNPSSPGAVRPSPLQSPAATSQDSLQFPKSRPRPTSWDSTKEYKPLYLVESNRRGSNVQHQEPEEPLPALPPSQRTSRSSSQLDSSDEATFEDAEQYPKDMQVRFAEPLSINTRLVRSSTELLDSQQSTPKAGVFQYLDADQSDEPLPEHQPIDSPSLSARRSVSPQPDESHDSRVKTAAEVIAGAALVSSIGYFASSPVQRPTDKSFLDELPSHSVVQRQPSPVDPVTKDRSSYLLQSSPMSRQTEEDDSVARDQSPTSRQRPLQSDKDMLHSIRERDRDDVFEQSRESQALIEQERERALDTLSGSSRDQPTAEDALDLGEQRSVEETLPESEREPAATDAKEEVEPSDEFFVTKSKKDKKKDKKNGKGLLRSSTQDDVTLPETSPEPREETPISAEVGPTEQFSLPKSKKDKKKGKGLSRSSTQDDFPIEEPSRETTEEPTASADLEPSEECSTPKSKKDKKKDKKKAKYAMTSEPDEEPASQPAEESVDTREAVSEEASAQDNFVPAETTKKSKKDKKKRKSVTTWEPEEVSSSAPIEKPTQESSQNILEGIAAPAALGALGVAAYQATKLSEEPRTSFQHQEEEKASESAEHKSVNVFDFQDKEKPSEPEYQPTIPSEPKEDEQPSESTQDILPEAERDLPQDTSIFDDFTSSTSKKNKKKGKSDSSWEPEEEQAAPPSATEGPQVADEFVVPGSKKGKKSQSWAPEEALPSDGVPETTSFPTSQVDVPKVEETPADDGLESFVLPGSKKSKKKGKKSQSWTPEENPPTESVQESIEPPIDTIGDRQPPIDIKSDEKPADRDFEEFVTPGSKKGKKKSKSKTWDLEPESQAQIQDENPVPDMEKSLESENIETTSKPETFDGSMEPSSKKGKKKSRKPQILEEEPLTESQPEISADKSVEPEAVPSTAEISSSGPTPTGGPGAWATVRSTPWATANEEAPKSPGTGYFPSAAILHSPQKRQSAEESKDSGYFPSAGAAVLAVDHHENKSDDNFPTATSVSRDLEGDPSRSSQPDVDSTRPVPDGLKAGYDNDQLSLARQLQEEFGSGGKKSKKDKKRQSLPATSDRDLSRSRDPNEGLKDHHRARSLSIGPSPGTERLSNRPISEDRKNVYSEDQLELARQLKAEFEGGNKKSKKDKRKRQGLSRTSTQDDSFLDQPTEEPEIIEPGTVEDVTARDPAEGSRDGFDAGYQEDQLSLARQLQAEFGSGSKKSKKEKKRRSASQTPTQEPEPNTKYFGNKSQPPVETERNLETASTPGSSGIDKDAVRDGLAVGYNEDQLELARQLKEEFGSGSSKSKKGKKDKKRQSLLRNTTEDDFSSDFTPKDDNESRDIDPQGREIVEAGPGEPAATEPKDEFAFTTKRSKKDKKGKKRESLVLSTNNDVPPETTPKDSDEPRDVEFQEEAIEEGPSEPALAEDEFTFTIKKSKKDKKGRKHESLTPAAVEPEVPSESTTKDISEPANIEDSQPASIEAEPSHPPAENPEDEFDLTRKKSKKDKKGKKRDSVLRSTADDAFSSDNFGKAVEALHNTRELPSEQAEPIEEAVSTPTDDDWALHTKKSKKDKKKRQNLATQDSWDQPAPEADSAKFQASEEPSTADVTAMSSATEPANEPTDDFGFSIKESKKDKKKRQSLLRSSTFDDTPEPQPEVTELPQETTSRDIDADTASPAPTFDNVEGDGFEVPSKKSKRDKKKRQSTQEVAFADETPIELEQPSSALQDQPINEDLGNDTQDSTMEAETHNPQMTSCETTLEDKSFEQQPAETVAENPEAQFDNFAFTTKKSRKDKKKRKDSSIPDSDEPSGILTPIDPIQGAPVGVAETTLPTELVLEKPDVVERALSQKRDDSIPAEVTAQEALEDPVDEWGSFSTKKSKKDKKKRKSGISTPIEEPTLETETVPPKDPVDIENIKEISGQAADPVEDEWDSFTTKKSKKDKKNRKHGLSTPTDDIPVASQTVPQGSMAVEDSNEAAPEQVQDPADEEWGSFTTKKSKKDKKKSKSGLPTPSEEVASAEPETVGQRDLTDFMEPVLEEKPGDPVGEEWDFFTTKKSKKDKKKSKSGLSTPLEETVPEPVTTLEREVVEHGTAMPELQETFVEPEATSQKELSAAEEVKPQPEEPVDDEWGSFTSEKSKKDKKKRKSGLSTPLEILPEPESSTSQRDLSDAEEPKSQLEELMAGGVFTTKKSKKDQKNKFGSSIPKEGILQPEDSFQETQRSLEESDPPVQETVVEPESAAQQEFQEAEEPKVQELGDDELAFTSKKSKRGKKSRSGLSTPLEEAPQPEFTSLDDQAKEEPVPEQVEDAGEEEWGSFTSKKSKKAKKKSGLSTPIEETLQSEPSAQKDFAGIEESTSQLPSTEQDISAPHIGQTPGKVDDTFEFTTKKSKKDKKNRKFGLSAPIDESVLPTLPEQCYQTERAEFDESRMETWTTKLDEPKTQPTFTEPEMEHTKDLNQATANDQEATEEAFDLVTKKSKKDKKKRKSGLSTPIEETLPTVAPEETSRAQPTEIDKPKWQNLPNEPEIETSKNLPQPADDDQEVTKDDFWFATKKSKKDKKKRKSGLSTPVEETLPTVEPEQSSRELEFNEPTVQPESIERDAPVSPSAQGNPPAPAPEIADSGFESTTKKSKKDKKGKRTSPVSSESGPTTSATPPASVPSTDIGGEEQAHLVSERFTQSSIPFEKDLSTEQAITEPDSTSTIPQEVPLETQVDTNDELRLDLGRKPSKKDKRKRQATVANIIDSPEASKAPLTSWADEVEEAEVERKVPVIEDIAKDESLSQIASTTEAVPVDDFSRPTKKGKKDKKTNSNLTRETSMEESFRPSIGEDAPEEKPDDHSDIPILAATGAVLAGAALLSQKSGEERTEPVTSMNDPATPMTKEADIPPPTRKLSKKEKRKQSIDRRTPKDDPFDDPALWESAEPRSFAESKDANDDAGSDGFWSAPNREDFPTEEPPHAREASHEGPVDLFATSHAPDPAHEHVAEDSNVQSGPPRDPPRPEQQWNDLPDEYVTSSSKRDKKKNASRLAVWDTPQEQEVSRDIEQPRHPPPEPRRTMVEEAHVEKRTPFEQRPSTPPNDFVEESPIDRDLSFQDEQFRPRSSLRYSHHGSSGLPVVREENPAQIDSERFERPSYTHGTDDINRDSAFVTDSPIPGQRPFADEHIRDSGVHLRDSSPAERAVAPVSNSDDAIARLSWPSVDETTETVDIHRSQRPKIETPHHGEARAGASHQPHHRQEDGDLHRQFTSDVERPRHNDEDRDLLTSQNEESHAGTHRTKTIHQSHAPEEERHRHHGEDRDSLPSQRHEEESYTDLHRTKTIHRSQKPDSIVNQRVQRIESPDFHRAQTPKEDKYGDLNISQRPKAEKPRAISDNSIGTAAAIAGATVGFAAARQASREQRPGSAQSQRSSSNINRLRTPDPKILRPESVGSNRSSGTPPLRRSDRKSGDLRSLSQRSNLDLAKEAELAAITAAAVTASTTATSANPQANEGRVRAKEMADVYDGFGEGRIGSPRSPTRPHSMRRRQSMQVLDLEQRLEQLAAENRALADAKAQADRALQTTQHASSALVERDAELDSLKRTLAWLQNEVTRLTEVNDGLTSASITLGNQHNERYNSLESQHAQATRELQEVRDNLSAGMEGIMRNEVQTAVQEKDGEIAELRAQLEAAKEQIREMQRQILASKANDGEFLTIRDEDYFDNACQQLCQHVQQWVLRFSKFSDMRACRLTSEINNDKIIDRLDNAILDGSDVDNYLADRVKRRDVFMSMTMTMVWEFVFTRYLFGMDREQRQKLKSLEKLLSEVGPASAVHQWRATTLTLLSKREAFVQQREQDTLAVVNAVLETLTEILPPPSHLEEQIQEQLTRVMKAAVDLSIEMRTQRAEYMMLPPLQPEYDANGDLASKVSFNAALMNERSGDTVSNEELEAQKAVVRIVLFPLVVKKGDDSGEGDEEIVVCPAQVLVAKPKKQVRIFSNGSQPNHSRISMQSGMPADYGEGSVI